ncbi:hypothetical protein [Salipaludibacillus sp. CF4.18]
MIQQYLSGSVTKIFYMLKVAAEFDTIKEIKNLCVTGVHGLP